MSLTLLTLPIRFHPVMFQETRTSRTRDAERSEAAAAVDGLARKLRTNKVRAATIIAFCENLDRNGDYLIHTSDLIDILNHSLGKDAVSKREMTLIAKHMDPEERVRKGLVSYRKFLDIFSDALTAAGDKRATERWEDQEESRDTRWASQRGSVGEWLKQAACPSEIANFRTFIACLEEFERNSGMKCIHKEDGFVVPLGPDLKASVSFYMK